MIPQNDTVCRIAPDAKAAGRWVRTSFANLQRDTVSGKYRVHAKVGGQLIRRVLPTRSLAVAKGLLDDLLKEERGKKLLESPEVDGFRFKQVANAWMVQIEADPDLKPRAKQYRLETLAMWRRVCPELDALKPQRITIADCKAMAARVRARYSASRFNGCVETLRAIFNLAIERGLMVTNPALQLARIGVKQKLKTLPPERKFREILAALDANPARARAALVVRFLAYCGARPTAAGQVLPEDVDWKRNELRLPPIKHQHEPLVIPMSKDLRAVVGQLLEQHPGHAPQRKIPLLPIKSPRRALRTVCRELHLPHLTTYDLRHLFTTHLLEQGVEPALVAALRGDRDGGAMLLKTYFHARNEKLHAVMRKVRW